MSTTRPGTFSTRDQQPHDQLDAWREFMKDLFDMRPSQEVRGRMVADSACWDIGGLLFTRMTFEDNKLRHLQHWPQSPHDDWCLVLSSQRKVEPSGLVVERTLSFRSLTKAYEGSGFDFEVLSLHMPREQFPEHARELDRAASGPIHPTLSTVLADYLQSLARNLPGLTGMNLSEMNVATKAVITACLAPSVQPEDPAVAALESIMVDRARQVIRSNMASPDFGPEQLRRLLAVSRSKLYRCFKPLGGVARFVQRERLAEARRRLSEPARSASIQLVAADVGFIDHSTFSRAFRREFGVSPSDVRDRALTAMPVDRIVEASCPGTLFEARPIVRNARPCRHVIDQFI